MKKLLDDMLLATILAFTFLALTLADEEGGGRRWFSFEFGAFMDRESLLQQFHVMDNILKGPFSVSVPMSIFRGPIRKSKTPHTLISKMGPNSKVTHCTRLAIFSTSITSRICNYPNQNSLK